LIIYPESDSGVNSEAIIPSKIAVFLVIYNRSAKLVIRLNTIK